MKILDPLHNVIDDLDAEGHHLAGRLRDVAEHLKADLTSLGHKGEKDLSELHQLLADVLAPQIDHMKAELAAEAKRLLAAVLTAVEPVLTSGETDARKALADALGALRGLIGASAPAKGQEPVAAGADPATA